MRIQKYQVPAGSIPAGTVPDINFAEILELQKQGNWELAQQKLDAIARYNFNTIYNEAHPDHPLPANVAPSHGGEIKQGPSKLYKNAYDRWTTETANGQEFKRFVNGPLKFALKSALLAFGGNAIANEFKTYGALGGAARVGTGFAGSYVAEKALGNIGKYIDSKLNTNFLGTTGRIAGGLLGFGLGTNAATNGLRYAAGQGVNIGRATNPLRRQYFDNLFSKVTPIESNGLATTLVYIPQSTKSFVRIPNTPFQRQVIPGSRPISTNKFATDISITEDPSIDLQDARKFAISVLSPGEFSPRAAKAVTGSQDMFRSAWMRARLKNMGYIDSEIDSYISSRIAEIDPSTISIAEDLNKVVNWKGNTKTGEVIITGSDPVTIGSHQDARHVPIFGQQFVQVTKKGNLKDIIMHEVGGHGTEKFNFTIDKSGKPIYNETTLTDAGHNAGKVTGLGDGYYLDPKEQRARFLVTADQMSKEGYNPNSFPDFVDFAVKHQNDLTTTNVGQTVKFYNLKNIWPAFSRAMSFGIPITIGTKFALSNDVESNKQGGKLCRKK